MDDFTTPLCQALRAHALTFPEVSEGTSCVNRAFKVRKKNFLFVGEQDGRVKVMLKLTDSLAAAAALDDPRVDVGKIGWVTVRCTPDDAPDLAQLQAWVTESWRAMAPKAVVRRWEAA